MSRSPAEPRPLTTPRVIDGRWYDHREHGFTAVVLRDPCAYCGGRAKVLDHIDPLSRGGEDAIENLTAACAACNTSKNRKTLLGFLGWRVNNIRARQARLNRERQGWNELGGKS